MPVYIVFYTIDGHLRFSNPCIDFEQTKLFAEHVSEGRPVIIADGSSILFSEDRVFVITTTLIEGWDFNEKVG